MHATFLDFESLYVMFMHELMKNRVLICILKSVQNTLSFCIFISLKIAFLVAADCVPAHVFSLYVRVLIVPPMCVFYAQGKSLQGATLKKGYVKHSGTNLFSKLNGHSFLFLCF